MKINHKNKKVRHGSLSNSDTLISQYHFSSGASRLMAVWVSSVQSNEKNHQPIASSELVTFKLTG